MKRARMWLSAASLRAIVRRPEVRIAVLLSATVMALWPASHSLWRYWIDHPFFGSHGALEAVISLWLLYRARDRITAARVSGLSWLLPLLVAGSVATLVVGRAGLETVQFLMLPLFLMLAIAAAYGTMVARTTAVPVCFLLFSMPVWDLLAVPLQKLTVEVVKLVGPMLGLPLTTSATLISLPGGISFNVTVWCSGQGALVQGLAVATLIGELLNATLRRRIMLLASMVLLALLINWIRVLTIIDIGYSTGMRHVLVTRYHVEFGFVLYAIVFLAFIFVATTNRLRPERRAAETTN